MKIQTMFKAASLALLLLASPADAAIVELTSNGNFEAGDTSDWVSFPSSNSTFDAISGPASDVFDGTFSGKLENLQSGSAALVKQANLGVGVVEANQDVMISFWAMGSGEAGGVQFAEFFSELDGGGVSSSVILGGGPLFLTDTYSLFEFTTTTGADVSGGVTLQLNTATGANAGSTSTFFVDNVSVTIESASVPEPGSLLALALGGASLAARRRRRRS